MTAIYQCLFEFLFGFLGIGATVRIRRESWCLQYVGFLKLYLVDQVVSFKLLNVLLQKNVLKKSAKNTKKAIITDSLEQFILNKK